MNIGVQEPPKAFAVRFRGLDLWNVGSHFAVKWGWSPKLIRSLGDVLFRRVEPLDSLGEKSVNLLTIRFDGSIEPRPSMPRKEIKGKLFHVYPNDVVFSKIDVRNGAIGIVPTGIDNACVTSEFPAYFVQEGLADPRYIKMLFRSKVFMRILNSMISGASGRKRIQPTHLENVKVPIPPLSVQKIIVDHWNNIEECIRLNEGEIQRIENEITNQFVSCLGLRISDVSVHPKILFVTWKAFERWSVNYNQARKTAINLALGKYPVVYLGSLLEKVQYGTSGKANRDEAGFPIIRMNNIIDGKLNLSDLKYISLSERDQRILLLNDGDILFNRTNSKELVGKCAVFHEEGDYVFASYLIRMRVNKEKANPDFIAYVINGPIGRRQIDALSRQIIGQANINSQEIRSLRVPLPPLEIQNSIMGFVSIKKSEIADNHNALAILRQKGKLEIEEMILGLHPIADYSI